MRSYPFELGLRRADHYRYQYPDNEENLGMSLSGAQYVENVDEVNRSARRQSLTPGPCDHHQWPHERLPSSWVADLLGALPLEWLPSAVLTDQVVAPKSVISAISQSGSFLDGGASHP